MALSSPRAMLMMTKPGDLEHLLSVSPGKGDPSELCVTVLGNPEPLKSPVLRSGRLEANPPTGTVENKESYFYSGSRWKSL